MEHINCCFGANLDICAFQVVDIPEELIENHDLTVDYILTPTRVIKTNCQLPKPQGIIWTKVQLHNFSLLCDCKFTIQLFHSEVDSKARHSDLGVKSPNS